MEEIFNGKILKKILMENFIFCAVIGVDVLQ